MPAHTQSEQADAVAILFDLLMGQVEPDLVSTEVDTLDARYANETPEDRKLRGERYAEALRIVDAQMSEILGLWKGEIIEEKRKIVDQLKVQAVAEESQVLSDLDTEIHDA